MLISFKAALRTDDPVRRAVLVPMLSAIAALVTWTAARGLYAAFANDDFPEALAVKVELLPLVFPLHMITGSLALILLPLAIALRRRPKWHRPLGRLAAADVLVAALTAYPVAWVAPVTFLSALGFSAQATTWLALLALGLDHIRHRRIAAHWRCMLLMTATTAGAIVFRLLLAGWAILGSSRWFETFYACDAWVGWLLPLMGMALVLRARRLA